MNKIEVKLYEIQTGDDVHTILETPHYFTEAAEKSKSDDEKMLSIFNLIMVDVSGSMSGYWDDIMRFWNENIALDLQGDSKSYAFGGSVYFLRNGDVALKTEDFLCESTNLTEAISTTNTEIMEAKEDHIRFFLITDGHHNATEIQPDEEIAKLHIPSGKTIEVFLLGLGTAFPVEYSLTIRSALHNGNANVPSLFWAKCEYDNSDDSDDSMNYISRSIQEQILSIADIVKKPPVILNLVPPGHLAPGFPELSTVHMNEFIYFPHARDKIAAALNLVINDGTPLIVDKRLEEINIRYLMDKVFRQWNSLIIQRHRQKLEIPPEAFRVMEIIFLSFYKTLSDELETLQANSIQYRLTKKNVKFIETEFSTLLNQSKTIIGLEGKYESEYELAQTILKTTVKSKYDMKILKMKGHDTADYLEDMEQFSDLYEKHKLEILALPEPPPDDCCRVTMGSMVKDLQDPYFPTLMKEDKFTFLKTFTVTGLPVYVPVKGFSQINPWTLCIRKILESPFTIVSQSTLELSAEFGNISETSENKEIFLQEGDENTRFNAIIPVFTAEVAKVLRPLIKTNVFTMLSTFCILKNPHILDHNAHLAALGCAWMKLISDYPANNRPQFVVEKLALIKTTASLYIDRAGIKKYVDILLKEPEQALMTESTKEFGDKHLKCESLIKPMFILYLSQDERITEEKLLHIVSLLLLEFIGRCLPSAIQGLANSLIYIHLFVPDLYEEKEREEWFDKKVKELCSDLLHSFKDALNGSLLDSFYKIEDLEKALSSFSRQQADKIGESLFDFRVNMKKVKFLKHSGAAGNITSWSLKVFAKEMSLPEKKITEIFDEKNIFACVYHGIQQNASKDRLSKSLPSYDEALKEVKNRVKSDTKSKLRDRALSEVLAEGQHCWEQEFMTIHEKEVVKPMTPEQIIRGSTERGVEVTKDTFNKVFRYNPKTQLLRNACMITGCPHYLKPNRSFNQHISKERKEGFLHQLHMITVKCTESGGTATDVMQSILRGYKSVNNLKIPSTPAAERVNTMEESITQLMTDYRPILI